MAKVIQFFRGSTAAHSTFVGAKGEITVDTDKNVLVAHDGVKAGGYPSINETSFNLQLDKKIDKNLDIVAATGTKITYDANGLVTAGTTLVAEDIPELDANKITTGVIDYARLPAALKSPVSAQLARLDIEEMLYTSGNLTTIRYSGDIVGEYKREELSYVDGNLSVIKHFLNTADLDIESATTELIYDIDNNLISTTYTEV